jgi:hypothetical protein
MLDSRDIEEMEAVDEEVLGMWGKAVRTHGSAAIPDLASDPDTQFTLLYQAALQGATAVVRAAGYRVRGRHNHQITFTAVAAIGSPELSEAARDLNVIRQGRHTAIYDWEATTEAGQLLDLQRATASLLREAYAFLQTQRPLLQGELSAPAAPSPPHQPTP